MPVRKIRMSPIKNNVRVATRKAANADSIMVESILEKHCCITMEFNRSVQRYEPQPATFVIPTSSGKPIRYTPDFLVQRHELGSVPHFVEVKPAFRLKSARIAERLSLVAEHLTMLGKSFEVVTDTDIYVGHRIENYELFYPYLIRPHRADLNAQLLLDQLDFPVVASRVVDVIGRHDGFEILATLLAHRRLQISWTEPFNLRTTLVTRGADHEM